MTTESNLKDSLSSLTVVTVVSLQELRKKEFRAFWGSRFLSHCSKTCQAKLKSKKSKISPQKLKNPYHSSNRSLRILIWVSPKRTTSKLRRWTINLRRCLRNSKPKTSLKARIKSKTLKCRCWGWLRQVRMQSLRTTIGTIKKKQVSLSLESKILRCRWERKTVVVHSSISILMTLRFLTLVTQLGLLKSIQTTARYSGGHQWFKI